MFHTPSIGSQLDLERQREMPAQAGQQRPCASSASTPGPRRRAARAGRRMTRLPKRTRPAALPA